MLSSKEIYEIYNANVKIDKSIHEYYSEDIPYFNGINTFDIANVINIDVDTACNIYNSSDEVKLLKSLKHKIPSRMIRIKSNYDSYDKTNILQYFASVLEKVRASIRKFVYEIDNPLHWKNTGDNPPKEPRFFKQHQISLFFNDNVGQFKVIDKKKIASDNRKKRMLNSVSAVISDYEYEQSQSNLFDI